jgi:hypothetical protein
MLFKSHFFFPKKLQIIVIIFFRRIKKGGKVPSSRLKDSEKEKKTLVPIAMMMSNRGELSSNSSIALGRYCNVKRINK